MIKNPLLPKIENKKKINPAEFKKVAGKVKKYLEEEQKYLEEKSKRYENNITGGFSLNC